jgi:hypothetical protein
MPDYLARFEKLVHDLKGRDYLEVVRFEPGPPIQAAQLKSVERELGAPLAGSIRGFYEECNGLSVHWRVKPTLGLNETKKLRERSTDYYVMIAEYVGDPFAKIDIQPLERSFAKRKSGTRRSESGKEKIQVGKVAHTAKEFYESLRPFDLVSDEYCAAFIATKGNGDPPVTLLGEGCSVWEHAIVCSFEAYIELVLATRGIVEARVKILGSASGEDAQSLPKNAREWARKYTPRLFAS